MNTKTMNEHRSLGSPQRMEITEMKRRKHLLLWLGGPFLALAVLVVLLTSQAAAAPGSAPISPAPAAQAGLTASNIPASTCTLSGTVRTCELWAMTGTLAMPDGALVPIWGFANNPAGPAHVPGPTLVGIEGETLEVILHNELLTETVALAFPGQVGLLPDLSGVAAGGMVTYTFPISAGTYLYEAGLTFNGARQVAMGLYGPLVVRPVTPTQAYNDPSTVFQDEALLVLGDIDPVFHNDPYAYELSQYTPLYWHINGKAYPETDEILTAAGNAVLLRIVNGGLETHWMGLLGLRERLIASDGHIRQPTHQSLVETTSAGQTLDILTTIPVSATVGTRYAFYDANLLLHNAGQRLTPGGQLAYGGMMTFLRVVTGTTPTLTGPAPSPVEVGPNPTTGAAGVALTATWPSGVMAAEFFTDTIGAAGSGSPMAATGSTATAFILPETLANWPSGFVIFYVRGQNGIGWGPVGSVVLNLDKTGPDSNALSLEPEPSNGTSPVLLRATGDDHSYGRNNVVAATYTIDGGAAEAMNLARTDNPITAMTATLTVTTLQGLAEGLHPIAITAEDSLGNLGAAGIISLTLDRTGPAAPVATLAPNPLDLSGAPPVTAVRLQARITDTLAAGVQSPLANAEGFVSTIGPDGTGFDLFPSDGLFDEIAEDAYFDIPIANFLLLAQGDHIVYVHGLDAAGNWGVFGQAIITIDRGLVDTVGPDIAGLSVTFNPAARSATVNIAGAASDPNLLSNVAGAEWFVDTDPGEGGGVPLQAADGAFDETTELLAGTIDVSSWATGNYTLYVRAVDSLGNWGPVVSAQLPLQANVYIYLPIIMSNP